MHLAWSGGTLLYSALYSIYMYVGDIRYSTCRYPTGSMYSTLEAILTTVYLALHVCSETYLETYKFCLDSRDKSLKGPTLRPTNPISRQAGSRAFGI